MAQPESAKSMTNPELEKLHSIGAKAWPTLDIAAGVFSTFIAQRVGDIDDADSFPVADLFLVCACTHQIPGAVEAFEEAYGPQITAVLASYNAPQTLKEEAGQLVRTQLLVAEVDKQAKIAEYSGRGKLRAFVRVCAVRVALALLKKQLSRRTVAEELWDMADDQHDPEIQYLKRVYRSEFKAAFAEAIAGLAPKQRAVLRYQVVMRLSIDQIGDVYGVHRATAARWTAKARDALFTGTRRVMMSRLEVDRAEVDSILRLIASHLDASAVRLLRD